MGEPAGIGGELTLKTWRGRTESLVPSFFALDDPSRLADLAYELGWTIPVVEIAEPSEAIEVFEHALPVLPVTIGFRIKPGQPDPDSVKAVIQSIKTGVELCVAGKAAGIVTNPINKNVMHQGGFAFPGHTEYLASLLGLDNREVMMLACPDLKVVPVTIHVSLAQAIATLTEDKIVEIASTTHQALMRDFGIEKPRLAIAGLNPHAGENGDMGREEIDIIIPAINRLLALGIHAKGPMPPDTMFHQQARTGYDVAICMYHDQALIPMKTLGFDVGVNATLGLPIVRTSPDHGTAFDLAGTGRACEKSLVSALKMAEEIARNRAA
jgi:4-hydroxythreonine-4-phosphate dehydrogenase